MHTSIVSSIKRLHCYGNIFLYYFNKYFCQSEIDKVKIMAYIPTFENVFVASGIIQTSYVFYHLLFRRNTVSVSKNIHSLNLFPSTVVFVNDFKMILILF